MSDEKKKRDWAIHINQVKILGRVCQEPVDKGAYWRVHVVLPSWARDGHQWIKYYIDFVGLEEDQLSQIRGLKTGNFLSATVFIVDRKIKTDGGDERSVKVLQADPYRPIGVLPAKFRDNEDPLNPTYHGICGSQVLLAGRHSIFKKDGEERRETPEVRDGKNSKFCLVNLRYTDPFQEIPENEKYGVSQFFRFFANGKMAEVLGGFCKHNAQLLVRGELSKEECNFVVKGNVPRTVTIRPVPNGINFLNFGQGTVSKSPVSPRSDIYDENDTDDLDSVPQDEVKGNKGEESSSPTPVDDDDLQF